MVSAKEVDGYGAENREIKETEQGFAETYIVTAYCPCEKCCGKTDGITSTGAKATEGITVAVDPNKIPYGSVIEIEGLGIRVAEDCGGAIKRNKIDLYFNTHEQAFEWGRQERKIKIIK